MAPSSPLPAPDLSSDALLSPNARIEKMMAEIDKQFDEHDGNALNSSPPQAPASVMLDPQPSNAKPNASTTSQGEASPTAARSIRPSQHESDADSECDGGQVIQPRGRAARRMFASHSSPLSRKERSTSPLEKLLSVPTDEEDEDLYSTTPMKPTRTARYHSPSSAGSRHEGLFVSPAKDVETAECDDDELPPHPLGGNDKLKELIAKKRAERLAREAEETGRTEHERPAEPSSDLPDGFVEDANDVPADPEVDHIMSEASRPVRKASKKALLEMERETQRLARQQALAHQMKTKKKFTTTDLFAKFNFRVPGTVDKEQQHADKQLPNEESSTSSVPNSDGADSSALHPVSTPPSTPPTPLDRQKALVEKGALGKLTLVRQGTISSIASNEYAPEAKDLENVLNAPQVLKAQCSEPPATSTTAHPIQKGLKLARFGKKTAMQQQDSFDDDDDDDDDLDIIHQEKLPPHLRAFEKARGSSVPRSKADSRAIHNLKHLSHMHGVDSRPRKGNTSGGATTSLNSGVLDAQLRKKAKEQARLAQLERIEELKAKGIDVQTAEQREKEAEEYESLLEKARLDAVELRKVENGGEGGMEASDDEDEEYVDSQSEVEETGEEVEEEEEEVEDTSLLDEVADETDEGQDGEDDQDPVGNTELGAANDEVLENEQMQEDDEVEHRPIVTRKVRKSRVIEDEDESDVSEPKEDIIATTDATQEDDNPFAAFNFGAKHGSSLLSPTQAFNATMKTPTQATHDRSLGVLNPPGPSSLPSLPSLVEPPTKSVDSLESLIPNSQVSNSQANAVDWEIQAPETPVPAALSRNVSVLQETPTWDPTQDDWQPSSWAEARNIEREDTLDSLIEHETQSTVRLRVSASPAASQSVAKRGRLARRQIIIADDSSEDDMPASIQPEKKDAFREMERKRREALTAAERLDAEREARQMMDEQAEESEDEYAGLGGDDFVAPETDQDREMIDSSHVEVDDRALAAHHAERERLREEQETSKLFKDLTTGAIRRKMGAAAFDLDEDEDDLAVRRRQIRQREEAKRRKALLKDENIATLAEGKGSRGKDAFLKAIADDEGDDDLVNLSDEDVGSVPATQDESQVSQAQDSTVSGPLKEINGNKRRHTDNDFESAERPPAKQRRTKATAFRRPTSLLEVKESVSFLLDEPNTGNLYGPSALEVDDKSDNGTSDNETMEDEDQSDSDHEVIAEARRQNDGGFAPDQPRIDVQTMIPSRPPAAQRRTAAKPSVVDRLSLKRGSSTSSMESAHDRTAWAAGPNTGGFKVPSLLRRATTSVANAFTSGANDRGVSTTNGKSGLSRESSGVKSGGSKKSSLAYQAREEERKTKVEASARRREENTRRIAELRRVSSAGTLGRGLTGKFE